MRQFVVGLSLGLLLPVAVGAAELQAEPERVSAPLLIDAAGCRGCHRIEGRGGSLGPDLAGVGRRLGRERLRSQLLEPRSLDPGTPMPAYDHLSTAEIELLLDLLVRL